MSQPDSMASLITSMVASSATHTLKTSLSLLPTRSPGLSHSQADAGGAKRSSLSAISPTVNISTPPLLLNSVYVLLLLLHSAFSEGCFHSVSFLLKESYEVFRPSYVAKSLRR